MSLPSYSRFLALLAHEAESEPPAKPGDTYSWSCGCSFLYACNDWKQRHWCPRHRHLRDEPQRQLLQQPEVGL